MEEKKNFRPPIDARAAPTHRDSSYSSSFYSSSISLLFFFFTKRTTHLFFSLTSTTKNAFFPFSSPLFQTPISTRTTMLRKLVSGPRKNKPGTVPVHLNVYDLTPINGYAYWLGLGVYHSGVQGNPLTNSLSFLHLFSFFSFTSPNPNRGALQFTSPAKKKKKSCSDQIFWLFGTTLSVCLFVCQLSLLIIILLIQPYSVIWVYNSTCFSFLSW